MSSKLLRYLVKRILLAILSIWIVITVTFFSMNAIPGGPFTGEKAVSQAVIDAMNEKYGLDQPVTVQYVNYLKNILNGDLGPSLKKTGRQVSDIISEGFQVSVKMGLIAAAIAIVIGLILGSIAAIYRNKLADKIIMIITTAFVAMPSFIIGSFLLVIFVVKAGWFPAVYDVDLSGQAGLVLPVICLMFYPMSYITRLTRSSMLDVLGNDFIRTARAYGINHYKVIYKHALRNSVIPVITYVGPMLAYIVTGSMVVEQIFGVPGLGTQFVSSITNRDYMLIMGTTIFLAALIIIMNLFTDIIYKFVDPRIDLE